MPMAHGSPTHNGPKTSRRVAATRLPAHAAQADLHLLKRAAGRIRLRDVNGQRSVIPQVIGADQIDEGTQDPSAPNPLPASSSNGDGSGAPAAGRRASKSAVAR